MFSVDPRRLERFQDELEKLYKSRSDNILDGSCKDFADYKERCGTLKGIEMAGEILRDTVINPKTEKDEQNNGENNSFEHGA